MYGMRFTSYWYEYSNRFWYVYMRGTGNITSPIRQLLL